MLIFAKQWIHPNTTVQKWLDKYPALRKQLHDRFDSQTFFGLPFTLLVFFSALLLWILFGIVQDYLAHDPFIAADLRIANLLFAFRSVAGVRFFYVVTLFASPVTAIAILFVFLGVFVWRKQWGHGVIALIGLVGTEGVTTVLKVLFHRTRPELLLRAITEDSFSLPSGHATTAAFLFGYIGYQAFLRFKSNAVRIGIVLFVCFSVALIDLSRMYLGVHFLSDVIAGNAIGFLGLCFVVGVDRWCVEQKKCKVFACSALQLTGSLAVAIAVVVFTFFFVSSPWTTRAPTQPHTIDDTRVLPLFQDNILLKYTETIIGERQEPIGLILVVPNDCIVSDFQKAGWTFANPVEPSTLYRIAAAAISNNEYLSAPITPSFYDTRPHDFGFEKPTDTQSVRERHHARFWKTPYQTANGSVVVGTASLDTGIKWGITHSIAPDIDTERETLVSDLVKGGVVSSQETLRHFVPPVLGKNFAKDFFFTNGDAVFLKLTQCHGR